MTDSRTVWQERVNALIRTMHETHALAEAVGKERLNDVAAFFPDGHIADAEQAYERMLLVLQVGVCTRLVTSLETFINDAAHFFLDKFFGENEALQDEDAAMRHRFIMRVLLYQAALDLNIIQQAVNQRRPIADHDTAVSLSLQNDSLTMADSVATMALDPLIHAGYLPPTTNVICYLDKNVRARLVPYDDTLLLRVAADSIQINHAAAHAHSSLSGGPSRDLLALLHEVGHHLYWNGRLPTTGAPIADALIQQTKELGIYHPREWRRRWLEEIFADAFALLLGGPAVVLDFQDMLTDDLPNHFKEDTDKHPIPELRPLMQTRLLRKFKDGNGQPLFTEMPDKLDERWRALIETRPLHQAFRIRSRKPAPGQEILTALDGLLDAVAAVLQPLYPSIMQSSYFRQKGIWSHDRLHAPDLTTLYHQFTKAASLDHINKQAFLEIVGDILETKDVRAIEDPTIRFYAHKFSTTPKTFAQRVEELTGVTPANAPNDDWIDPFLSYGWSTEGPEGDAGRK